MLNQSDEKLFTALVRVAEQRLNEFEPQQIANTTWAFATLNHSDEKLFTALATAANALDKAAVERVQIAEPRPISSVVALAP